jgi:hypothetical protein
LEDNNRSGSESKPGRKPDCYVQHCIGLKDTTWVVGLTMNATNWSWDVGCRGNNRASRFGFEFRWIETDQFNFLEEIKSN